MASTRRWRASTRRSESARFFVAWPLVTTCLLTPAACCDDLDVQIFDETPPPPEAVLAFFQDSHPSPPEGGLPCTVTMAQLMLPAQDDGSVLGATTTDEELLAMTKLATGLDQARVACTVHQIGSEDFEVTARISEATGAEFSLATELSGPSSNFANVAWSYPMRGVYFGACTVTVDATDDDEPFIAPGRARLTFDCDLLYTEDDQYCVASGTLFVQDCK